MRNRFLSIFLGLAFLIAAAPLHAASTEWTSAAALDSKLSVPLSGFSTVELSFSPSGTISAGTLNFEVSDDGGTTWYAIAGARVDTPTVESTFSLNAATKQAWQVRATGFTTFRVRLNPAITGTGSAVITAVPTSASSGGAVAVGGSVTSDNPNRFSCVVPVSTATTIQAVGGSCAAPGAGFALFITDVNFGTSAAAGTAADSFPTLKSGTGGTCGSGTAVIWQGLTGANSTIVDNLSIPIKVAANSELCWIMTTAGSKTLRIGGYIARN
jgi:hypothetical protein